MTRRTASLPRRLGAICYDAVLVAALLFLVTIPFVAARGGQPVEADQNLGYQLSLVAVIYVFFVGFWSWKGRTLGMQSWGLRIETPEGKRITIAQASLRFLAAILSWLPIGLGFWWQLWDRHGLSWHDRISGTRLLHYQS